MKNWVYYMQRGLQSMWSKKPKNDKKYAIDFNDRTREKKINDQLEIETKLKEKFSPVHIDLVDKSHTHTPDKHIETMKDKERLYDLTIIAEVFKPMSLVERHMAIYDELDIKNNPGIHGIKIKASSPDEIDKLKGWLP